MLSPEASGSKRKLLKVPSVESRTCGIETQIVQGSGVKKDCLKSDGIKKIINRKMIRRVTFSLISLVLVLLTGCREGVPEKPLKFTAYKNNPVLSPGEAGSWDELFLWTPQIVRDENKFYLFYLGGNVSGRMAVGFATSEDGFHFKKFAGNPVLSPDNKGFDAFTVGPGMVVKDDSLWRMYFNAQELVNFAPGRHIGRASSKSLEGPWIKEEQPVLASGEAGEWDAGFILPSTVLKLENGTFIMFYSGGLEITLFDDFFVGMATSKDGKKWKKYNNPETTGHPFAESDPVLTSGKDGEWDDAFVWMANVTKTTEGFSMYYSASAEHSRKEFKNIGFASSADGIHWKKYRNNPVYLSENDPFIHSQRNVGYMENPSLLYLDTLCLMFYECGHQQLDKSFLAVATAQY